VDAKVSAVDVSHPYKAVCPSLDGDVLRVLAGTSRGLTGREVALLTGRTSHSGVLTVLNRLTRQGLISRVELNHAHLFSANREHLAWPAVEALVGIRNVLLAKIRAEVDRWEIAPVHTSLFGSTARGTGGETSDIDLFVVRPVSVNPEDSRWREQLEALGKKINEWTGNRADIQEASEGGLQRLAAEDRPIVTELRADAITLAGPRIDALLGEV
jgi:predicted nucleotidyltransferase